MPECLPDEREVNILSDETGCKRVLQHVRVTLVGYDSCRRGKCLKQPEELRAVELPGKARPNCMKRQPEDWRRGWESNPRMKVLQTSPFPLGYRAVRSV